MNYLFAVACLSASLSHAAPAQLPGADYPKSVQVRATTLTQALAHRVHLNEGEYVRIKQLHLRFLNERQQLQDSLTGAPAAERDAQLAAAQARYEQALSELLRPEQRLAYQQLKASMTAHRL